MNWTKCDMTKLKQILFKCFMFLDVLQQKGLKCKFVFRNDNNLKDTYKLY